MTTRSSETRLDALLRSACDVIAQRGMANTRTADVARAAGVSQALVFYHFTTKEQLLGQAFAYAARQQLARIDAVRNSAAAPLDKLRRLLRLHGPPGQSSLIRLRVDGWSQSVREAQMERVSRELDLGRQRALAAVIAEAAADGSVSCEDPEAAAWRIMAVIDGLTVQLSVHPRLLSRARVTEWVRLAAGQELGLDPDMLR